MCGFPLAQTCTCTRREKAILAQGILSAALERPRSGRTIGLWVGAVKTETPPPVLPPRRAILDSSVHGNEDGCRGNEGLLEWLGMFVSSGWAPVMTGDVYLDYI